jgi:hypothetical protein
LVAGPRNQRFLRYQRRRSGRVAFRVLVSISPGSGVACPRNHLTILAIPETSRSPRIVVQHGAKFGGALPHPFVCLADRTRRMWHDFRMNVRDHCQHFGNRLGLAIPMRRRRTANSAERTLMAVMAVPHPGLWEKSAASIGSNGSTSSGDFSEIEATIHRLCDHAATMMATGRRCSRTCANTCRNGGRA